MKKFVGILMAFTSDHIMWGKISLQLTKYTLCSNFIDIGFGVVLDSTFLLCC